MTALVRAAALSCTYGVSRAQDVGARISHWLLAGPAQRAESAHAGAVAGWVDGDGRADYVYPEITGYFLQWLAWQTRSHGRQPIHAARAEAALEWLAGWLAEDRLPTRIYVDTPRDDWRNDASFTFDLAVVLRGIGAAAREGLITPSPNAVDRACMALTRMIAADGELDACIRHRDSEIMPDRWSTRRGPFLAKAAAGILDAAEVLPNVPAALLRAAQQTFDRSVEALVQAPHDETHPFLYAIEGFLARPHDTAFAHRLPKIATHFDALVERSRTMGRVPEAMSSAGVVRLDIVAQVIRAGLLLDAHRNDGRSPRYALDSLAHTLAQCVRADGALPFSPDAPAQCNVWTAMFAEQALALVNCGPSEIARMAASPSIV